ncbi:MAG TPA: hypothetical protein VG890_01655 [Puia sp.]|nr:hypothetical protein [Puia sp.]
MKYALYTGLTATVILILSCFMSWAYYPDIQQTFTGFYSHQNNYGKPGFVMCFMAVLIFIFLLIPRLWAKRSSQVAAVFLLAYAVKTFILFASCYNGICPEKRAGLFLMLGSAILILFAALFTGIKLSGEPEEGQ